MSQCTGCGNDDIYGRRRERRRRHTLEWLCSDCRNRLLGLPAPQLKRRWIPMPLAGLLSGTILGIAAILAIGAHW